MASRVSYLACKDPDVHFYPGVTMPHRVSTARMSRSQVRYPSPFQNAALSFWLCNSCGSLQTSCTIYIRTRKYHSHSSVSSRSSDKLVRCCDILLLMNARRLQACAHCYTSRSLDFFIHIQSCHSLWASGRIPRVRGYIVVFYSILNILSFWPSWISKTGLCSKR